MTEGLVIGKFMPLHLGHLALIEFALGHCDRLTVLLCVEATEPIFGDLRESWLQQTFEDNPRIRLLRYNYHDADLPATSVSSRDVSARWTARLRELAPTTQVIISSEAYGRYVAEIWGINYRLFDLDRKQVPVSATMIRARPYTHRRLLAPAAQPDFVQKIVLHGTESTGKSTLTPRLAKHFGTAHVPEMARQIVEHTSTVRYEHLLEIAALQAATIRAALSKADGLLIIDTDIWTTLAYSRFLFSKELPLKPDWLTYSGSDLCLYLSAEVPLVDDGTRLPEQQRYELDEFHRVARLESGVETVYVWGGSWEKRTMSARGEIKNYLEGR